MELKFLKRIKNLHQPEVMVRRDLLCKIRLNSVFVLWVTHVYTFLIQYMLY